MRSILQSFVLIIFLIPLVSCAARYTVNAKQLVPAGLNEAVAYEVISVDELEGEYGKVITPKVKYLISNVQINGKNKYSIDKNSNISWQGRVLHKENLEPYTDVKTYNACVAYNKRGVCLLTAPITERKECNRITFNLDIHMKLVDKNKEKIIAEKNYSYNDSSNECKKRRFNLTTRFDISNYFKSIESFLHDFREDIAPYTEIYSYNIDFWENSEGMNNVSKKYLEEGISLIKKSNNNIDFACSYFLKGLEYEESSPTLNYNLGACAEINEDYDKSLQYYERANEESLKIDNELVQAINRVIKFKKNKDNLAKQLKK